jgi:hypothetical protein
MHAKVKRKTNIKKAAGTGIGENLFQQSKLTEAFTW